MKGSDARGNFSNSGPLFGDDISFIVAAAHELKSPLALMRQLALSLESGLVDPAQQARIIRQITLTSERALRLTTDLSRSSRLEDSLFELEPVNPHQICEEVAQELTPLYAARGREIKVASSSRRPILAVANRDLLRRIMMNFSDNALHYAESSLPVQLRASSHHHGAKVRLEVRDYGPALPSDLWRRVMANLGAGTQALHARPQSSGLGLYVAGQFAEAMYGDVGAIRHRDGATFYVDIDASTQLNLL